MRGRIITQANDTQYLPSERREHHCRSTDGLALMRRAFLIILVLGIITAFVVREVRLHSKPPLEAAYVAAQSAPIWDSTAEVRTAVANLSYGEPVQIFQRDGGYALVRTSTGLRGWVDSGSLLSTAVWRAASLLNKTTESMAVQARGHTRARSNLHIRAGRQWEVISAAPGDTRVEMFARQAAANVESPRPGPSPDSSNLEDWWLVRANVRNATQISGWVLGRFVGLDLPEPLPEYQSSEHINIVAWFVINHAVDSTGAAKPEYLVAGTRDGEGRPCDFTLIRVFTWSAHRHRYETAFMERGLCGSLPVQVTPATAPGSEAHFTFNNVDLKGREERRYEMTVTTVRRVDSSAVRTERKRSRKARE
ncbi:MAG TPA: SH3 domain-containing protein [Candidatus Acidoferrales bacterium]|nr:SH3 domain-containing protein [Candidatus Acidoferrales bacterium]